MKIAIVRLSAMGDIVNSAYILPFIKEKHPEAVIDWFCEEMFAPLLDNNPHLNAVHTVSLKRDRSIKGLLATVRKLKSLGPYDKVIDLQGLIKSALVAKYLGKKRYGFDKHSIREPFASNFYQYKASISYAENSLWRTAFLINYVFDTAITKKDLSCLKPSLYYKENNHIQNMLKSDTNIIFVVGSSQAYKNYPIIKIIQTIKALNLHTILIWGSQAEYQDALQINKMCHNSTLGDRFSFNNLIQLVDKVDLTIGNDTGPTHIAWALGKKSITLFGATPASKMMWQTKRNIAIESDSIVNPLKLNKEDFSIAKIDPKEIVHVAKRLLDA